MSVKLLLKIFCLPKIKGGGGPLDPRLENVSHLWDAVLSAHSHRHDRRHVHLAVRPSAVDLNWIGSFVMGVTRRLP